MITMKGETVLMNNLFKETKNLIKYLAIGDDDTTPEYTDTKLGNEILRVPANIKYNTNLKGLVVSADFEVNDLENAKEIGLITSNGDLITHDTFNGVPGGYESTIHLEYNLLLEPYHQIRTWKKTQYTGVYLCLVNDTVEAVYERTTNNGYTQETSLKNVIGTVSSFYYDSNTRQLYIHPSTDEIEPVNLNIQIKVR